jgi:hypothetical protein
VLLLDKEVKLYNKNDFNLDVKSVIVINKGLLVCLSLVLAALLTVKDKRALIFWSESDRLLSSED